MEFQEQQGIYQQIANHLCEEILLEKWQAGFRVPSVREFAAQVSVNPNTVQRAYTQLEELGVLYNRRGIGFFVQENARHRILEWKRRDFLARDLPELFRKMDLLQISLDQLREHFEIYRKASSPR